MNSLSAFDKFTDEQLAEHINAAVAELKARHAKQEKEMAAQHSKQIATALSQTGSKRRGRKPKEKSNVVTA